jgi:hypothetical protein
MRERRSGWRELEQRAGAEGRGGKSEERSSIHRETGSFRDEELASGFFQPVVGFM